MLLSPHAVVGAGALGLEGRGLGWRSGAAPDRKFLAALIWFKAGLERRRPGLNGAVKALGLVLLSPYAVVGAGALGLEGVGRGWPWGRCQRLRRGGDFNGWWGRAFLVLKEFTLCWGAWWVGRSGRV